MKPIPPLVLGLFGGLALAVGFAHLRHGAPPRFLPGLVNPDASINAVFYLTIGLAALYYAVVGVQAPADTARARRAMIWLVSLSLAQAMVTLAVFLLGALLAGIAGVGAGAMVVVGLAPLTQTVLAGFALSRLVTGWPWVRLFIASGIVATVVLGLCLLAVTEDVSRGSPVEEDTSFPIFQVLAVTQLLPVGLAAWLNKHGVTDEYGGEIGLVDDED